MADQAKEAYETASRIVSSLAGNPDQVPEGEVETHESLRPPGMEAQESPAAPGRGARLANESAAVKGGIQSPQTAGADVGGGMEQRLDLGVVGMKGPRSTDQTLKAVDK